MNGNKKILLAFYGDDFTGSTDALEFITRAGAKAVLFTELPTAEQLKSFPDLDAYGVAGKTRALPPDEMEKILQPAFEQMKVSGAKHIHYKVCSTFDSSPTVGSIGKAIDYGAAVLKNNIIPVLGGSPSLGRYCLYGNLFAQMGIGSNGKIYRLDRHPSMIKHPVTPANESDLRLHLGKQTNKKFGLIDILQLEKPIKEWKKSIAKDEQVVLIDSLYDSQLEKIGEWMNSFSKRKIQFSVGGSGIEVALGKYWNKKRVLKPRTKWRKVQKAKPLLVLSGSCSPVTKKQIQYALTKGFIEVPLIKEEFNGETGKGFFIGSDFEAIIAALKKGKNVIIHSGNLFDIDQSDSAGIIGKALGNIAKEVCKKIKLKRVVVAGGDTSSYAARAMEIDAVEMIAPVVSGAPLCKAYSKNKVVDGLEVNFKGGQVGGEDYFGLF